MLGYNLIPDPAYRAALEGAGMIPWNTYARTFTVYIDAQVANISTNPNYSRFGQHDQNVTVPAVTPQSFTVSGYILYANQQPWEYIAPENRNNYQQDKLRNSQGVVTLTVDPSGYVLLQNVKSMNVDGFNFMLNSNARPRGLFSPVRYTYTLQKVD